MTLRRGVALALLSLAFGTEGEAQLAPEALADSARALFAARGIPGGQVVILRDGQPYVQLAVGLADVEAQRPVTDTTLFRVGSVIKLFTATAAALLWERGALDIDAPVSRTVPEFPPEHTGVTARRLAGHIAGIRHLHRPRFRRAARALPRRRRGPRHLPCRHARRGARDALLLHELRLQPPRRRRAARGQRVVPPLSGARGPPAARARAHRPGAQRHSAFADLAVGYNPGANGPARADRTDLSDRYPSGGYLSTASDIAHFAEASVRGPWLTPRVHELLFTTQLLADSTATNVGFGWRIGADSAGRAILHHGGASVGGRAMLMAWRDAPLVVAITTNLSNARVSEADAMRLGSLALPAR